jgi:CTP synthase
VISLLEEQIDISNLGGTMRLGLSETVLKGECRLKEIYGSNLVYERHRHRYEVSNQYRKQLSDASLNLCGFTADNSLVEAVEWPDHPWGIGVQFHPEFISKPIKPSPIFTSFVEACLSYAGKNAE